MAPVVPPRIALVLSLLAAVVLAAGCGGATSGSSTSHPTSQQQQTPTAGLNWSPTDRSYVVKTPLDWRGVNSQTIKAVGCRCSLDVSAAGWARLQSQLNGHPEVLIAFDHSVLGEHVLGSSHVYTQLLVESYADDYGSSDQQRENLQWAHIASNYGESFGRRTETGHSRAGGFPADWVSIWYTAKLSSGKKLKMVETDTILVHNAVAYEIWLTIPAASYHSYQRIYRQMVQSFKPLGLGRGSDTVNL